MKWTRVGPFLFLGVCLLLVTYTGIEPTRVVGQSCCLWPTGETTAVIGADPNNWSLTEFKMTLTGSGTWDNWGLSEYEGDTGDDGCYNAGVNTSYVPEYTSVGDSTWTVGSGNVWQADYVGWYPASVTYIRQNSPLYSNNPLILTFPCGADQYQDITIKCPINTTPYVYDNNVRHTDTVEQYDVKNSRAGVYQTISR